MFLPGTRRSRQAGMRPWGLRCNNQQYRQRYQRYTNHSLVLLLSVLITRKQVIGYISKRPGRTWWVTLGDPSCLMKQPQAGGLIRGNSGRGVLGKRGITRQRGKDKRGEGKLSQKGGRFGSTHFVLTFGREIDFCYFFSPIKVFIRELHPVAPETSFPQVPGEYTRLREGELPRLHLRNLVLKEIHDVSKVFYSRPACPSSKDPKMRALDHLTYSGPKVWTPFERYRCSN